MTLRHILFLLVLSTVFCQAQDSSTATNTPLPAPINVGTNINSTFNDFAPIIAPDGQTIYFLREGHPGNNSREKYSVDVWSAGTQNGNWLPASRLSNPFNTGVVNSIYSISPDGNTIISNWVNETPSANFTKGFGIIKKTESGWAFPVKLNIPKFEKYCKGRYQYGSLSADGKTFLMSFSETKNSVEDDIYVAFLQKNGEWTEPINLGDDINTNATECIPFLSPDGFTLYFSSNREGGMGKNDIYMAKRKDRSFEKWTKPVNLGKFVNSEDYDAFFTTSAVDDYAYFVTHKNSFGKGDIVRMKMDDILQSINPNGYTPNTGPIASNNGNGQNGDGSNTNNNGGGGALTGANNGTDNPASDRGVVLLTGKLLNPNGKVPEGAQVIYEDLLTGQEIGVATPDPNTGIYKIVLPYGKKYGVTALADGYLGSGINIDISKFSTGKYQEITGKDLNLVPAEKGQKLTLNNIFFEFGKTTLQPESFTELNRLIQFLDDNRKLQIEIGGHTDNIGSDEINDKISAGRAQAVRSYLMTKGKIAAERIQAKGYGKTKPVATNDTEEGQAANRRVEFTIVKTN
jgi:OmpA-OmpF porin, OOP family